MRNIISFFKKKLVTVITLYVCSIILFSFLYMALPANSFYHSTIQYENNNFNKDVIPVSNELEMDLNKAVISNLPQRSILQFIHVNNISFKNFPESVKINYHMQIEYETDSGIKNVYGFMDSFLLNIQTFISIDGEPYIYYVPVNNKEILNGKLMVFDSYENIFDSQIKNYVHINKDVYNKIIDIGNAYLGFPKKLSGQFFRMLYLSIGVATTMTFGDILPITNTARIFIVIQNLFTLVFLGFLIDASVDLIKKT